MPARNNQPITVQQRRARLGIKHHLATATHGRSAADIAADLVVLHATDPASVYLSVAARADDLYPADIAAALYDERSLIRMLGMRRTMFVVPTAFASKVQHAAGAQVAARLRRALVTELGSVVDGPDRWLAEVEDWVVGRLRELGGATGLALSRTDPRLRTKIGVAEGKSYGGAVAINSRVLNILSAQGRIVRGRPGSGWTGSQYEWAPIEKWLPGGLPTLGEQEARAGLARGWLARFGPGTLADIAWWTGWNLGETRRVLSSLDTVVVDLDGTDGYLLAGDLDDVEVPPPWVALLPALDPTPMGWKGRDWYIGPDYRAALFDRTGNIGPSIFCDGRVVGGWGQRASGEVAWRLFEDIGAEAAAAVPAQAARLTSWLDGVRVIPKFRTPLDRELSAP